MKNSNEEMKVSVYCLTYNHEKYIQNALEGFVNQKVNFKYEVWVHDDASKDNTQSIIREYAEKYPEIIKPIYQVENQRSKGVKILREYILPNMTGKYISCCEGDDYWCDEYKLQKQVDFLEANKGYIACVHNSVYWEMKNNEKKLFNEKIEAYDVLTEQVIHGGGVAYHTSSLMYRIEYAREIQSESRPEFFDKPKKIGDYPLSIFLTCKGKVRYIPDIMSVYRHGTAGSWSEMMNKPALVKEKEYSLVDMLLSVDEYTNYKMHSEIQHIVDKHYVKILNLEMGLSTLKNEQMLRIFKMQDLNRKIRILLKLLILNKLIYYKK